MMNRFHQIALISLLLALLLLPLGLNAAEEAPSNQITPGEFVIEPATLISLGFEWYMVGDSNRDAKVEVQYRKTGESEWQAGLPLLRLNGERTFLSDAIDYTAPNMFAGSLFDLEPDTEYEARFVLTDADGVTGNPEQQVTVRTRAEPMPYDKGNVYHVYPPEYAGEKQQPAFGGLLAAYYMGSLGGDWSNSSPPRVQPGDTILVHAGVYKDNRYYYSHELINDYKTCCGTTWDGTYYLTQSGTEGKPITIKAAGDGEVIFDGDGNEVLFDVMGADHLYFEGITFRNTRTAILAGRKHIAGTTDLTVKHSRFEDVGIGIHTDYSGSRNYYIADNVFIGRHDPDALNGWLPANFRNFEGAWDNVPDYEEIRKLLSYYAIKIYGAGHVVAYNRVENFHDGIDHATYGNPDGYPETIRERMPVAIDIYNNDISNMHDNCIEGDGAMHNIRILRNRCFNSATGAMSPQPIFGGPAYFIRNVVYHGVGGPLKVHGSPAGAIFYHNTYIGEVSQITPASNMHFRNNLILGQGTRPAVFAIDTYTRYSSSDYNGFRPNPGAEYSFIWRAPANDTVDYTGELTRQAFKTLDDYRQATGQDQHSRIVDYNVFRSARLPDPADPTRLFQPEEVDLRLKKRSAAVDAGEVLPNINDGYTGKLPDLGAYETGRPAPHYGPREQYRK